ncbi:MAG: methyltransferase domain-containing protein [Deltaproteobacteria bacterium]|nr:methyltransferase domain-containing protein [Deltaproteobacteria bacterium]
MFKIDRHPRGKFLLIFWVFFVVGCASTLPKEEVFERNQEHFDRRAQTYDKSFDQWVAFEPAHNLLLREAEKRGLSPEARILDVASGTGILALRLAEKAPRGEIVGMDISPEMVEIANQKAEGFPNVEFVVGNVEAMPFPDETFDVVTCSYSFHHFPDPDVALEEIHRVLKKGGKLYIIDPYKAIPFGYVNWALDQIFEGPIWFQSARGFRKLYQQHGFQKIDQKRQLRRLGIVVPAILTVGTK